MLESLNHPNRMLELNSEQFACMMDSITTRLCQHLASLDHQPASQEERVTLTFSDGFPETATPLDTLLDFLFTQVIPNGYNTTSPGFLGYFGGGGLPHAAAADLIAGTVNRFVGRWSAAPAAVQLEAAVTRWLVGMVGYPAAAQGMLTSGGSQSNLTAIFTARQTLLKDRDLRLARLYVSDQAHFSLHKGSLVCGLPANAVREVPSDAQGRMRLDLLQQFIQDDRRAGYLPFMVVATGGTFGTGSVDDIDAIADIAQREHLWSHLDGAYGGFFALTSQGRDVLNGMERYDSITLDPHKSFFLPYGTGTLMVRNGALLKAAHAIDADFYGPMQSDAQHIDFCSYSTEQSRQWRGLRLWLPLMMHGIEPFRRNLEEKLQLARYIADALEKLPDVVLVTPPMLSVVAFRWMPPTLSTPEIEQANKRLLDNINGKNTIFLMGTRIKGEYALRLCVLSFRTHLERVQRGLDDIRTALEDMPPPTHAQL